MNTTYQSCYKRRSQGFALLETLIAFIVMAVGLLALLSFHSESQKNVSEAKSQAEAVALAEEKLQELESFLSGPTSLAISQDDDSRLTVGTEINDSLNPIAGVVGVFNRQWTIEDVPGGGKRATVWVDWKDRNDEDQEVRLSSEIYYVHPVAGPSNFLQVLDEAAKVYGLNNRWGDGTGSGEGDDAITGDREIVETLEGEPSNDPIDGELENTYIFAITVSGSVSRTGGATGDVIIEDTSATAVDSLLTEGMTYEPSCSSTNNSYSCILYYSSAASPPGWTGTITIRLGEGDLFCETDDPSPGTWSTGTVSLEDGEERVQGELSFSNSGLLETKVFNIVISGSAC